MVWKAPPTTGRSISPSTSPRPRRWIIIDDAAKFLDDQGIKIDTNTQKYSEDKLNGKDIVYISWSGTDKDGPASVGLAVLILDEKTVLVLTYWGTQGEEDKHMPEIGKILNSIKLAQ